MNISEKIARIHSLDNDLIPEAIEDAERLFLIATKITSATTNDGTQNAGNQNSKEIAMINYTAATQRVDELQDELYDLKLSVLDMINKIVHDKERRFAKLYYVDGLTQKSIAQKTSYQYGTVRNTLTEFRKKEMTPCDTE